MKLHFFEEKGREENHTISCGRAWCAFRRSLAVNLFFPNPSFFQIYFEAIANAFDAGANKISILISSDGKIDPSYLKITITDNGCGFTNERFDRFSKLRRPQDKFHKGLGRLVFLHYFSDIEIVSNYNNQRRIFSFSNSFRGQSKTEENIDNQDQETLLLFNGFLGQRLKSYDDIKPNVLKGKIIEHFLPLFYNKKKLNQPFCINIDLSIRSKSEQKKLFPEALTITSADIPEFKHKEVKEISIHAFHSIDISYSIAQEIGETRQVTAVCIDDRTIPISLLPQKAIPPHYTAIFLIESPIFTGNSDSSRQRLNLPESISEHALNKVLRKEVAAILNKELPDIEKKNIETMKGFEERFPHLSGFFDEDTVGIIDKDEAIYTAQGRFFNEQKKVLESDLLDEATYHKSLEISSRTLTEYILYRELIINRLSQFNRDDQETKIHNLIVPRYKQFKEDSFLDDIYSNNAWLLDDKFMSFRTILSEAMMKDVIAAITLKEDLCDDYGRPDISMIFSADPNQQEMVDVVVIEIKKKKADDKEGPYAATQLLKRARKIVEFCPNIQRIWYFAVLEIDNELAQILQDSKWTPLFSKGKVFYQDYSIIMENGISVLTPICLLSYDAIIKDASTRNRTFLEILKRDIKKTIERQTKN